MKSLLKTTVRHGLAVTLVLVACSEDKGSGVAVDSTPPGRILSLAVQEVGDDRVVLEWGAPGDDEYSGQARTYEVRFSIEPLTETSWSTAAVVASPPAPKPSGQSESLTIAPLSRGVWHFGIKSADEVPNWSPISNTVFASVVDSIFPSEITDLTVGAFGETSALLIWTAPGSDGTVGRAAEYDLRYSLAELSEASWAGADRVVGLPAPDSSGVAQEFRVTGLERNRTYFFGLKTLDLGMHASGLSNVVSVTTALDDIPPNQVTDLAVSDFSQTSITLGWTAPGNNGTEGRATEYDLRQSFEPLNDANWESALRVVTEPPAAAGAREEILVEGLETGRTYYFALRASDGDANWSVTSNVVSQRTNPLLRLTQSPGPFGAFSATWSPNSDRIAFQSDWSGNFHRELYLTNADGSSTGQLTTDPEGAKGPQWTPDGERISFLRELERQEIWIMDARTGATPSRLVSEAGLHIVQHAWSPDGSQLAYLVQTSNAPPKNDLLVVAIPDGAPQVILSGENRILGIDWSLDGSSIIYSSDRTGNYDLWSVPTSGGSSVQIMSSPANEVTPALSANGRIAYSSDEAGDYDIWVTSSTEGERTRVTFMAGDEASPSWSPDHRRIAFEAFENGIGDLWIVALD